MPRKLATVCAAASSVTVWSAPGGERRRVVDLVDHDGEGALRGRGAAVGDRHRDHRAAGGVRHRRVGQRAGRIRRRVGHRGFGNQRRVAARGGDHQRGRFAGARRDARQVHRLERGVLVDGRGIGDRVEGRRIVHVGDHDGEGARRREVVRGGAEVVVEAAVGDDHRDDRAAAGAGHRGVGQRAGGIRRGVGDRRVGMRPTVSLVAVICSGCVSPPPAPIPLRGIGLLRGILADRRRVGDRVERRQIVHRVHRDREGAGEHAVVDQRGEVVVEAAIGHGHRDDRGVPTRPPPACTAACRSHPATCR